VGDESPKWLKNWSFLRNESVTIRESEVNSLRRKGTKLPHVPNSHQERSSIVWLLRGAKPYHEEYVYPRQLLYPTSVYGTHTGMVKAGNQRDRLEEKRLTLKELYCTMPPRLSERGTRTSCDVFGPN
jgi:hypothetical protein